MHRKAFSPGDIIFRQGDKSEEAFWILSGKVQISVETAAGPDVLTTLDDGCLFSPMDLPLYDQRPFVVSRSHCRIECKGGGYFVRDVGSLSGTIVNGVTIGADHPSLTAPLTPGENSITVGPAGSPHQYWIMLR